MLVNQQAKAGALAGAGIDSSSYGEQGIPIK